MLIKKKKIYIYIYIFFFFYLFFFYPLFFQEGPIEIKRNLFFQGVLAKMAVLKFHKHITHIINTKQSKCHGAHTREEQEHGDEDVNSNNSI